MAGLFGLFGDGGRFNKSGEGLFGFNPNEAMLYAGLGLLSGRNTQEQFANAASGLQSGFKAQKERKKEKQLLQDYGTLFGGGGAAQPQPVNPQTPQAPQSPGVATGAPVSLTGMGNSTDGRAVVQRLVSQGVSPVQAAAIAGNIQQESSFNPQAINTKEGAHGLIQWRGPRFAALQEFARSRGKDWTDRDTQIDFIGHEMGGSESRAGKAFRSAQDVEAANQALRGYIRYGDNSDATRLANARAFLGGGGPQQVAPAAPTPSMPAQTPMGGGGGGGGMFAGMNLNPQQEGALQRIMASNPALANSLMERLLLGGGQTTTDDLKEYGFAKQQGYQGSFLDFKRAQSGQDGDANKPPSGYRWNADRSALEAIPGGPAVSPREPPIGYQWAADGKALEKIPGGPAVKEKEDKSFEKEAKLRSEFDKQVEEFGAVHDAYGRVLSAVDERAKNPKAISPASDMALVFGYMKMLDPASVVREGEFATAQNAGGVEERIRNLYNKAVNGQFLEDSQRQDFIDSASRLYGRARKNAEGRVERYKKYAESYEVDPNRVTYLPEALQAPQLVQPQAPASGPAMPDVQRRGAPGQTRAPEVPRPQTQADFDALPSGAEYIDPADGKRYRKP